MLTRELTLENHRRFVERVTTSETVWGIRVANGFASAESDETAEESPDSTTVLLFWSDRAYAARARRASYPEGHVESLTLFDFLFRWLPGMRTDRVLAGTNWTGDLIGIERKPDDLQDELLEAMGASRAHDYLTRLKQAIHTGRE